METEAETIDTQTGWLITREVTCMELFPVLAISTLNRAVPTPTLRASLCPVGTVVDTVIWANRLPKLKLKTTASVILRKNCSLALIGFLFMFLLI